MTTLSAPRPRTRRKSAGRGAITPQDLLGFKLVADPQIAPDGKLVVFVHKNVGEKNDYVANLWMAPVPKTGSSGRTSGLVPRQFTAGGKDSHPRWSPDGSRIAFIGARTKHRPQLFTIGADGGEAVALTRFDEGSIGTFKWSPDGRTIAVSFRAQDPEWTEQAKKDREPKGLCDPPRVIDHWWYRLDGEGYFNGQRYHLYLVDVATGEHRRVYAKDTLGMFSFDFSPDSGELVISTNRDRRASLKFWNDELLRLKISTGKLTPIPGMPRGPKDNVRWSPDGRSIAYAGREGQGDGTYSTENLELWVCDLNRGKARCLTGEEDCCLMSAPMSDTAEVTFAPILAWSPDSRRVYVYKTGTMPGSHSTDHGSDDEKPEG